MAGALAGSLTGRGSEGLPARDQAVVELVLGHAVSKPRGEALREGGLSLSYADLAEEAGAVAAHLAAIGAEPGDRVALYLGNTLDFVVVALGCLWLGATFVPLAVTDPAARVARIVGDCDPVVIVAKSRGAMDFLGGQWSGKVTAAAALRGRSGARRAPPISSGSGRDAYLIYTSGTSGVAKGVRIPERAFHWSLLNAVRHLGFDANTRSLAVSAFHFDGSFATLFGTLLAGGALVVAPREDLLFLRPFFGAVVEHKINATSFSPSYLRLLVGAHGLERLKESDLAVVALGGEEVVADDIARLWQVLPDLRVFNRYGPTEATIAVTSHEVNREEVVSGSVPIGRPHEGVSFHVVGKEGALVKGEREVGELCIGGRQLMRGYWGDANLTETVLRSDIVPGEVVYMTGDLVYRGPGGVYFYVGRADDVVKREGVRLSLDEVARGLREVDGVRASICLAVAREGRLAVAAFVVAGANVSSVQLLEGAARHLPSTMLPDEVVLVSSFPMTGTGKIDRHRLLAQSGKMAWERRQTQ